jgi:hypothetical protein
MRRRGVEDIKGEMPFVGQPPKQPRRKLSKAELREQAAAAFLAWREVAHYRLRYAAIPQAHKDLATVIVADDCALCRRPRRFAFSTFLYREVPERLK